MRIHILFLFVLFSLCSFGQSSSGEVVIKQLQKDGNILYENNKVVILSSAREKYDDMIDAISQARRFVHLEYFNFRSDSIGNTLLDVLKQKAYEGVEVRLILDGFNNSYSSSPITKEIQDSCRNAGVRIELFDPMRFPYINHVFQRDHRKIVVVDGKMVYTGGMNVADYYLYGKPKLGNWHDTHIRMEGPVVDAYESIFNRMWYRVTGEILDSLRYCYSSGISDGHKINLQRNDSTPTAGDKKIVVVSREPRGSRRAMRKAYVNSINAAKYDIRIVNPYPTNIRPIRRAMYRSLRRGVRLQIMVSSICDSKIVPSVVAIEMKKFMHRGAQVYYYKGGFHHSKIMMIDDEFCTIGTANLDGISMLRNYEANAFVFDQYTTSQLSTVMDEDLSQCVMLTPQNYHQMFPYRKLVKGRFLSIFRRFM